MKRDRLKRGFLAFMGNEKRQNITIPCIAILISLLVGGILIAVLGKNPLTAYGNLLQGSGLLPKPRYAGHKSILTDLTSFLNALAPLIFASMAVAIALKAGLFNIGVSGQMLAAGFFGSVAAGYGSLSSVVAKPLALLVGLLTGAALGGLIGWLKYRFCINEVVSSIMFNYIAQYVIGFFVQVNYIDPVSRQSKLISSNSRLTLVDWIVGDLKLDLPLGIILALITVFLIGFLLDRTKIGYEIKAVGAGSSAAKYAGISVGKCMVLAMILSGGLAGLAGITFYMGYFGSIQPGVLSTVGFDAIAVSLLGSNHPIGIIASSFLIMIISKGSTYMSSASGINGEIASVITGLILLFGACGAYTRYKLKSMKLFLGRSPKDESYHN